MVNTWQCIYIYIYIYYTRLHSHLHYTHDIIYCVTMISKHTFWVFTPNIADTIRLYLSLYMYSNYTIDFFVVNYGSGRRFMYRYLVPTIKYPYNNIISTYMAICVVKGSSLHSLKYFVHYDIKCFAYLNILNVGIL